MTSSEAIQELDAMQRQIIHGSNIFGDIADVIRDLKQVESCAREYYSCAEICLTGDADETNDMRMHAAMAAGALKDALTKLR